MSGQLDFIYDSEIFVDLYSTLEIDMDAKIEEIKSSYLKLAKKNHPDQGGSSEIFQQITRAYEILYNKETRKEYDLYYLKKSMDEFKGDEMIRLKDEYKNFINANNKPISKDELDKLYAETFDDYKEKFTETKIDKNELTNRITDINLERENMNIETSDDSLANFLKEYKDKVNVNELFEYFKYKNLNSFGNNSIILNQLGTLDTLPGYSNGYSSFVDDNENFGSNLYSNISDMNDIMAKESMNNLNYDDFVNWKQTKLPDKKLTSNDIDYYLKKRQEEQIELDDEIKHNLSSSTKRKEVEKFLKTKHLSEDIDKYYNDLNENPTVSNNKTSSELDEMLNYMEKIREEDFSKEPNQIKTSEQDFNELKLNRDKPKINNVRKREFK